MLSKTWTLAQIIDWMTERALTFDEATFIFIATRTWSLKIEKFNETDKILELPSDETNKSILTIHYESFFPTEHQNDPEKHT